MKTEVSRSNLCAQIQKNTSQLKVQSKEIVKSGREHPVEISMPLEEMIQFY